jgi:hypothetical protein
MNTLICAGGSSQRVLTAVLNLCAAGLGPEELRLLVVDPDGSNGNGAELRQLVETYSACRDRFASGLGPGMRLFSTKLDLLDYDGGPPGVKVWSPVSSRDTLASVLNYDNLAAGDGGEVRPTVPPDVARLFFTEKEIRMKLDRGFMGHTAVGAAAMSLVTEAAQRQPWKQLGDKIRQDVSASGSAVAVVGSVFGGTGASAIHPLVRFLRQIPQTNKNRLRIAAVALVPYFRFDPSTATSGTQASALAAQAEWFPLRTRSAVEFYKHLEDNSEFDFNTIYWLGDSALMPVNYSEGGPNQRNPAHFVDILAALAVLDFFADPERATGNEFAAARSAPGASAQSDVVDWADVPLTALDAERVRWAVLRLAVAGAIHIGFFAPLFSMNDLAQRPSCVPWYYRRFVKKGDDFSRQENRRDMELLDSFFTMYHLPWWSEIASGKGVRLLNRTVFDDRAPGAVHLDRLHNMYGDDRPNERSLGAIDEFVTCMEDVPSILGGTRGVAAYLSLVGHAADLYLERSYKLSRPRAARENA